MKNKKIVGFIAFFIVLANIFSISAVTDTNSSNNVRTISISVSNTVGLDLTFIPIDIPDNFDESIEAFADFINRTYPLSDEGLIISTENPYETSDDEKSSLRLLWLSLTMKKLLDQDTTTGKIKRSIGILPLSWFNNFTDEIQGTHGKAPIPVGRAEVLMSSIAESIPSLRELGGHELAHTFGLCDERTSGEWSSQDSILGFSLNLCPNGDRDDNDVLDPDCEGKGCNATTLGVLLPWNGSNEMINIENFMGSASSNKVWIATDSYEHLLYDFQRPTTIFSDAIVVSGKVIKTTGEVILFPFYKIQNIFADTGEDSTGNYSAQVHDENKSVHSMK